MGGARFWWRVTRVETDKEPLFNLDEFSIGKGAENQTVPNPIPYQEGGRGLSYEEVAEKIYHPASNLGTKVLELTEDNPQVELEFDRNFSP